MSAARVLEAAVAASPDADAVIARSGRLTYRQLDEMAQRYLGALVAAGVRPGDRCGVSLPNDLPIVALFHAAMRLRLVWVGINRALAPPEKAYLLANSEAAFFVGDAAMVAEVTGSQADHQVHTALELDETPASQWSALVDRGEAWGGPDPDPLAPAAIAYTSGTTGFPKGAVHSQHNLMVPGRMVIQARRFDATLRKADCFPLTILNLQVLSTLLVPQCSGTAIVMDRVDPVGIAEWVAREKPTVWNGAPAMLYGLATNDEVPADALASLTDVWSGGSHSPQSIKDRFHAKFGLRAYSTYGSTEVPTLVAIVPHGLDVDDAASGLPLPHLALHIVDEDGTELPSGTTGEICVGPSDDPELSGLYRFMLEYWHNPDATAKTLAGGLLHTGDVGFLDDEGYLHVRDRHTSLILRGGANVYPAEVERVINEFAGVAASSVVGIPDERLGARVAAMVELEGSAPDGNFDVEGLHVHCQANLARYKVPETVLVGVLPRNAMGKVVLGRVQQALADHAATPAT
jgi:O-succinylbenzoic acid--CoA ligase